MERKMGTGTSDPDPGGGVYQVPARQQRNVIRYSPRFAGLMN